VIVAFTVAACFGASVTAAFATSLNLASKSLAAVRTCTVTATTTTTSSVTDASVRQASATSNFGTSTTNDVGSASSANLRLYLRFDLSGCTPAIPASATVRLATLRLYASTLAGACRTLDIFRVASAWTESAVTWNNQPFGTTLNNPAQSSRTDSFDAGTPTSCENKVAGYVTGALVTSDVAAFVAGTTNNGWMIRDDIEGSNPARTTTFSAKNLGTLAQAPQLVVTYVLAP
jgi:uncharacterized protein YcfJ